MRLRNILILAAAVLLLWTAPAALADEKRTTVIDVAVVEEQATHLFSIGWERGDLSVTLIAPDGTRIPQDDPPSGVRVAVSDRIIIFRVDNAMPGLWQAEFQEYDNGQVGVIVQKLIRPLMVENVTARQDGSDILVDFGLSGEDGKSCSYDVYLTLDGLYQNGRILASGTGAVGSTVSLRCPAGDVSSYSNWFITVYAECSSGGFTDFHSVSSDPFSYSNPDAPGLVRNLSVTLIDDGLQLIWQPPEGLATTEYLAVLYGEDGSVVHSTTVDAEWTEALLPMAAEGSIQVGVSAVRDTIAGLPSLVTIDTTATLFDLVGFDLPEQPEIISGSVTLAYDTNDSEVPIIVDIDDEQDSMTLTGDGALRLPVCNGFNRVMVSAQGEDGVWLSQSRLWSVDLIAPTLRIFEDWDALVTADKSILLAGNVAGASLLTVNGTDIPIESTGNFSLNVSLDPGMNVLTVTAGDASGNTTVYEARVTRQNDTPSFPWWLAGGLAAGSLAIVIYALTNRRRRRA